MDPWSTERLEDEAMKKGFGRPILAAVLALLPTAAHAGPPLLCWAVETGGAPSLPWGAGGGWRATRPDYPRERLVADTLGLLTPATPVLARMETLRRAAIYASEDEKVARELLSRLQARAREGEAKGAPDALAVFDVGYVAECFKQTRWMPGKGGVPAIAAFIAGPVSRVDGYADVNRAIAERGGDAAMEFAAALITLDGKGRGHEDHVQKALAGATEGSPLARNLASRFGVSVAARPRGSAG